MSSIDNEMNNLNNILAGLAKVAAAKDGIVALNDATDIIVGVISFPGIPQERRDELIDEFAKALGRLGQEITAAIGHRMPDAEVVEGIELAKTRMHEMHEQFIKEQDEYQPPEILVVDLSEGFKQNVRHN
jgi:hypothetical protein